MIDGQHRHKSVGGVAVFTDIRRQNMCLVFAGRVGAVMAAHAIVSDDGMVEVRGYPGDCGVTVIAVVAARNMSRVFAGCRYTVMTRAAAAQNLCVVNGEHWLPYRRSVTILANNRRLNMRRAFAGRIGAVVAAYAVACNIHMIEIRR